MYIINSKEFDKRFYIYNYYSGNEIILFIFFVAYELKKFKYFLYFPYFVMYIARITFQLYHIFLEQNTNYFKIGFMIMECLFNKDIIVQDSIDWHQILAVILFISIIIVFYLKYQYSPTTTIISSYIESYGFEPDFFFSVIEFLFLATKYN